MSSLSVRSASSFFSSGWALITPPWTYVETLTAAGMAEKGTIREHIFKAGQWRDSVVHAILDREWNGRSVP
ncbi:GNAT family protein [Streptomyces sp. SID7909]|uniref:GNAT family protein n=1 Tax=Streptomyces sp. SID7909 TaxID=2706092 RepID=UPI0013B8CAB8|nr:GNAT family protein [Streptomyces sp. SID7909]NEC04492.1 GNAT family N-acetyltransferase [Streptomyces sp. SID7909]